MFSSATNANIFAPLSPPTFLGQNAADVFLHHHHHHHYDLLVTDFLSANSSVTETLFGMAILDNSAIRNQGAAHELDFGPKDNRVTKERAVKKVSHRKICTAQGLRNRRVRLSIEIARKFFDLQDLLGFEKASETVDWLLTNSSSEIMDLMKNGSRGGGGGGGGGGDGGAKSITLSSFASEGEGVISKMKKLKSVGKGQKVKLQEGRATFDHQLLVSREARARARARARERTREKILRSKQTISSDEQQNFQKVSVW